jgi:hypothetical protein
MIDMNYTPKHDRWLNITEIELSLFPAMSKG